MPKKQNTSKVYTAKNGAKYIKLANGRCRFVKKSGSGSSKKKGGGLRRGGSINTKQPVIY